MATFSKQPTTLETQTYVVMSKVCLRLCFQVAGCVLKLATEHASSLRVEPTARTRVSARCAWHLARARVTGGEAHVPRRRTRDAEIVHLLRPRASSEACCLSCNVVQFSCRVSSSWLPFSSEQFWRELLVRFMTAS